MQLLPSKPKAQHNKAILDDPSLLNFDPTSYADRFRSAMKNSELPWNVYTDEPAMDALYNELTHAQFEQVMKYWDLDVGRNEGKSLLEWIDDDEDGERYYRWDRLAKGTKIDFPKPTSQNTGNTNYACFSSGTPVEMFDGTKKNIEDIKKGDIVKSYRNGKYTSGIVTKPLSHPINDVIPVAILGDIIGSIDHPIFINNKWYEISKAPINKEITHMFIENFYNLEIDGHTIHNSEHNYITNGYIMSGLGDHEVLNNTFKRQNFNLEKIT
jgi:hypothetical protein